MNKKIISPNPNQPIDRVPIGQLPNALAELTETALSGSHITHALPAGEEKYGSYYGSRCYCSYDGENE